MDIRIIGSKLRSFREDKGYSQLDLECMIDASSGSISRIENGKSNPTKETIIKITRALNVTGIETARLFGIKI